MDDHRKLDLYRRHGRPADLDAAVTALRTAHQAGEDVGTDLAGALLDRYDLDGADADLDTAIDLLDGVARPDPDAVILLANALLSRYERDGDSADLDRATELQNHTAEVGDQTQVGVALANLGATLAESPDRQDLDRGVDLLRRMAAGLNPADLEYPKRMNNLGNALLRRAERYGRTDDLDESVRCFQEAADSPGAVVGRHAWLSNLGNALCIRFSHDDERIEDLDAAIAVFDQAVQACPPRSPDLLACLSNLGNGLLDRYETTGRTADLDRALSTMRTAVERTPHQGVQRAARLSNLSTALMDYYAVSGDLDDVEEAVALCREAVAVMVPGSADAPRWFTNLGNGLMELYERRRDPRTLSAAGEAYREAVDRVDDNDSERPLYLSNLGTALAAHDRPGPLREAIRLFRAAAKATPRRSPQRATWLNNIGNGYADLFDLTRDAGHLRRAIRYYRKALRRTPQAAPEYVAWSLNLALALAARWSTGTLPRRTDRVDRAFRDCCRLARDSAPEILLRAAGAWARWSNRRGAWSTAAEAFDEAISAAHALFAAQVLLEHRHTWLAGAVGLSADGGLAHVRAGDPHAAVAALERGRALQLSEAFQHTRLDRAARQAGPDIHSRFRQVVADHRRLSVAPGRVGDRAPWRDPIADRRQLRDDLATIVAEIRRRTHTPV